MRHHREKPFHASVIQQGLVVPHQELIELEIRLGDEGGDAIEVGGDFGDLGHRVALTLAEVAKVNMIDSRRRARDAAWAERSKTRQTVGRSSVAVRCRAPYRT